MSLHRTVVSEQSWSGGLVATRRGALFVQLNGDDTANDAAAAARRWAVCLLAAADAASTDDLTVPSHGVQPDVRSRDLSGELVALWDDGDVVATVGAVETDGQVHTPLAAREFARCLLAAAGEADAA